MRNQHEMGTFTSYVADSVGAWIFIENRLLPALFRAVLMYWTFKSETIPRTSTYLGWQHGTRTILA